VYGLGRIAENISILVTFCEPAWEQKWPPFGHFESDDLVFWWVSRYGSLTHSCHISASHVLMLRKDSAKYDKKCDFGIQNGRLQAILDQILAIIELDRDFMAIYLYSKFEDDTSKTETCSLFTSKSWRTDDDDGRTGIWLAPLTLS